MSLHSQDLFPNNEQIISSLKESLSILDVDSLSDEELHALDAVLYPKYLIVINEISEREREFPYEDQ